MQVVVRPRMRERASTGACIITMPVCRLAKAAVPKPPSISSKAASQSEGASAASASTDRKAVDPSNKSPLPACGPRLSAKARPEISAPSGSAAARKPI